MTDDIHAAPCVRALLDQLDAVTEERDALGRVADQMANALQHHPEDAAEALGSFFDVLRPIHAARTLAEALAEERAADPHRHVLYRFYDADLALLYVGLTIDPGARWRRQSRVEWWPEVVHSTMAAFPSREAVVAARKLAIWAERPRYNVLHNDRTPPACDRGCKVLAISREVECECGATHTETYNVTPDPALATLR